MSLIRTRNFLKPHLGANSFAVLTVVSFGHGFSRTYIVLAGFACWSRSIRVLEEICHKLELREEQTSAQCLRAQQQLLQQASHQVSGSGAHFANNLLPHTKTFRC